MPAPVTLTTALPAGASIEVGIAASPLYTSSVGADGVAGTPLPAGTSRSGSIATGGTAQDLAAANTARRSLTGQNISTGDLWINEDGGAAAADTVNSWLVPAGAAFAVNTNEKVSIVGATTGQKFSATET